MPPKKTKPVWIRLDEQTIEALDRLALALRRQDPLANRQTAHRVALAKGLRSA